MMMLYKMETQELLYNNWYNHIVLVLLMGDDYDKSFTEAGLLSYGYPDVTDRELEDMILDNWWAVKIKKDWILANCH